MLVHHRVPRHEVTRSTTSPSLDESPSQGCPSRFGQCGVKFRAYKETSSQCRHQPILEPPSHWSSYRKNYMPPLGGTSYSGLYREAPPQRGAFFKLAAVCKRVGKIATLVDERVTRSAAQWKKWWLKRSISKGASF